MNYKRPIKERTFQLSINIISLLEILPRSYIFEVLGKQLLRSGTSIGANIHEAQGGSSKKDFIYFYCIALKSANETKYWIRILQEKFKNSNKKNLLDDLLNEVNEISKILGSSIITMRRK